MFKFKQNMWKGTYVGGTVWNEVLNRCENRGKNHYGETEWVGTGGGSNTIV